MGLKLYNKPSEYKQEMILTGRMSWEELASLHNESDVFVQTSHGEAWSQPAQDALAYGKPIVVPSHTGYYEYGYDSELKIKCHEDICFGSLDTNFELYNSNCTWWNVDILDLQKKLRKVYNEIEHYTKPELRLNRQKSLEKFSYRNVGEQIRRLLER
jgi:glycosyltransferase involved in cell wall biosynthesis